MVKVVKMELIKVRCSQCKYAVIIGDTVICTNRSRSYSVKIPHVTNINNECLIGKFGKPMTDNVAIHKLIQIYAEIEETLKELEEIKSRLANMIKENVESGKYYIHDKVVIVGRYKKKTLDVKRVKELLKKSGVLDKYLVEKEIKYIKVKSAKQR